MPDEWQPIGNNDGWQDITSDFDTGWEPITQPQSYDPQEYQQASQGLQGYEPLQASSFTPSADRDYSNASIWSDIANFPDKLDEWLPIGPGEVGQSIVNVGKGLWNVLSTSTDERVPDFDPTSRQSAVEQMERDQAHFWDRIDPLVQTLTNPFKKAYYKIAGDQQALDAMPDSGYKSQGFVKDVWHTITSPEASGLWEVGTAPSRFLTGVADTEKGLTPLESGWHAITSGLTYDEEAQRVGKQFKAAFEGKPADQVSYEPDTWQKIGIGGVLSLADPASWLTGELIGRAVGKIAEPLGKGISKLSNAIVDRGATSEWRAANWISTGIKEIGQTFSKTAFRSPEYVDTMQIVDRELRKKGFTIPEVAENLKAFDTTLDDIAKNAGKSRDEVNKLFLGMERKYKPTPTPYMIEDLPDGGKIYNVPDAPLSDPSPIPLDNIKAVHFQADPLENGMPTEGRYSGGLFFKPAEEAGQYAGGVKGTTVGGPNPFEATLNFRKPMVITVQDELSPNAGYLGLERMKGQDYAKQLLNDGNFRYEELVNHGLPDAEALQIAKQTPRHAINRIANIEAKSLGYDGIIKTTMDGDATEIFALDSLAEMAHKGTLPVEAFKNSPLESQIKAVSAQMEALGNRLPEGLVEATLGMKAYREEMFAKAKEAGIDIAPLADEDLDYFLHMRTKEATKTLQSARPDIFWKGSRDIDPAHGSAITRKWKGLDINTLNEMGRKGKLPGLEGLKFAKFFEDDPVQLEFYRQMRDVNNVADVTAINDAIRTIGTDIKGWAPEKIAASGLLPLSAPGDDSPMYSAIYKEVKDLGVPADVKAFLENRVRLLSSTDPGSAARNFMKGVRDVWAHSTLNYAPSYVLRNELGNILNNSYSGMGFNLKWYQDSDKFMELVKRSKTTPEALAEGINGMTAKEWLDEMRDVGVYGGWSTAERLQVQRAKFAEKFREKLPGLMNVNKNMENQARIAQYMYQRIENGANPMAAQAAVDKYLFPYMTGLTERERAVQEIIPFYAWSRFNIPLQIQAAMGMTPRRTQINALSAVTNYLHWREPASDMDRGMQQFTPEYMQTLAGIPVAKNENGTMMFSLFGTFVPFAELAQLTTKKGVLGKVLNLLHPVASEIGLQIGNIDENGRLLFDEFGDNSTKLLGVDMSRRLKHVLTRVRVLGDLDRAMQGYYENPDSYTPTQKSFYQKAGQLLFGLTTSNVDYYREMKKVNWQIKRHKSLYKQYMKAGDESSANEQLDMFNEMLQQYYGGE